VRFISNTLLGYKLNDFHLIVLPHAPISNALGPTAGRHQAAMVDDRLRWMNHDTPKPTIVATNIAAVVTRAIKTYPSAIMSPPVGVIPVITGT
jgi:hypothetical protein